MTFPLPFDEAGPALSTYLDAMAERERCADAASLRHVLAPESVVVIGASRQRGTVGRTILDNASWSSAPGPASLKSARPASA
jgi:hypothetical protein